MLTSVPGKVKEQLVQETTSSHMKDKVISSAEHRFIKGKLIDQPDTLLQ